MIIDPKQEFIALQEEEYRDLKYISAIFISPIWSQKIAPFFHKSAMIFMAKVNQTIEKAEKQCEPYSI